MRYSGVSTTIANATIFLSPEEVEVVKVSVQKSDSSVELKKITYLSAFNKYLHAHCSISHVINPEKFQDW